MLYVNYVSIKLIKIQLFLQDFTDKIQWKIYPKMLSTKWETNVWVNSGKKQKKWVPIKLILGFVRYRYKISHYFKYEIIQKVGNKTLSEGGRRF